MSSDKTWVPTGPGPVATWHVADAAGVPLGRFASQVAAVLRGKHRATFTPYADAGDYVIVINAAKVVLTGRKLVQKTYYRHSGYPGGLKATLYKDLMAKRPEFVVEKAVRGMLPHTHLGRQQAKKLKVYAGSEHPHAAQQPVLLALEVK